MFLVMKGGRRAVRMPPPEGGSRLERLAWLLPDAPVMALPIIQINRQAR